MMQFLDVATELRELPPKYLRMHMLKESGTLQ